MSVTSPSVITPLGSSALAAREMRTVRRLDGGHEATIQIKTDGPTRVLL